MKKLGGRIEAAINIAVPDEVLIQRTTGRVSCAACKTVYHTVFSPPAQAGVCDKCGGKLLQRSDDQEETARRRLEVYHQQTSPLLGYYQQRGILYSIDGDRAANQVFADIQEVLAGL
jgi:adenylate kinase